MLQYAFDTLDVTYETLKDEELLHLINEGDNCALEHIFKRYQRYIKAKSRIYFLIGGDKNDIEQEAMLGLYSAIKKYKFEKEYTFKTFAEICITRQILTAIKSATRQKHIPLNSYISLNRLVYEEENDKTRLVDLIEAKISNNPEDIVISKESYKSLENTVFSQLSAFEIKILKLYISGQTYANIAKILRKDKKSVDNALQRIKKKISPTL